MSLSKNPFVEFLKATLAGGVLFLLPVVLVLIVLFLVSLLAGLVARTRDGRRIIRWSERSLLGGLPQYQLVKTMAEGLAHVENAKKSVQPALISIEDGCGLRVR